MIEVLGVHQFLKDQIKWAAVEIPGERFTLRLERLDDDACIVSIEGHADKALAEENSKLRAILRHATQFTHDGLKADAKAILGGEE